MQVTIEKPKEVRSNLYEILSTGDVGVIATENKDHVFLYILGDVSGFGKWYLRSEVERILKGSRINMIL